MYVFKLEIITAVNQSVKLSRLSIRANSAFYWSMNLKFNTANVRFMFVCMYTYLHIYVCMYINKCIKTESYNIVYHFSRCVLLYRK